jgi:hypothetical protein
VIYGKGRIDANHRNAVSQLTATIELQNKTLAAERHARGQDLILATEAAKRKDALSLQITGLNTYVDTLQDGLSECLSGADTDRLRDLW